MPGQPAQPTSYTSIPPSYDVNATHDWGPNDTAPSQPPGRGHDSRRTSAAAMTSMTSCRPCAGSSSSASSTRTARSTLYGIGTPMLVID